MADDTDYSHENNRETNEVIAAIDKLRNTLAGAIETIRPPEKAIFVLDATRRATHVRMRIYDFVFSATAAAGGTVTLAIGALTYTFDYNVAGTFAIPLPILVDRGVDMTITTTGTGVVGYLTYTPE